MLEFDECDQLLVTSPFPDDNPPASSTNSHGIPITLTRNSSFQCHPLRSRSVSPPHCDRSSIPPVTMVGTGGEAPFGLLGLDSSSAEATAVEDRTNTGASEANRGGGGTIIHPVRPFHPLILHITHSCRSVRTTLSLAWPFVTAFLSLPFVVPTNCGHLIRFISVPSS